MKTSKHGIKLIEAREGIRLKVYRDSKGLPTVGVGHLIVPEDGLKVGNVITQEQCDAFLAEDLKKAEAPVNAVGVPLKQWQFDALVSLVVNIGGGGFSRSSVRKRLQAKDYNGAAKAMMMWVTPREITGRRQTEQNQFLHPDHFYTSAAEPKPDTAQTATEAAGVGSPNAADLSSAEQPPTNTQVIETEKTVETGDSTFTEKIVAKAETAGDKFQSFQGVLDKFGFSIPDAKASLGTKLMVGVKFALGGVMLVWGALKEHPEYFIIAALLIGLAVLLWDRSRKRVVEQKQGMPVDVAKAIVEAK